jgi:hypothetical protein
LGWVHRSYYLHELKNTEEARDNLLRVVDKFLEDPIMRYNLACYECQLGKLEPAKNWLQKACEVGDPEKIKWGFRGPRFAAVLEEDWSDLLSN